MSNWAFCRHSRHIGIALLIAVAALSGCGFEPLMGQSAHPAVQTDMQRIRVATISERSGQILRNYLLEALTPRGLQGSELYVLSVSLSEPRREVAIRRDDTASRLSYSASAAFVLRDKLRVIFSGNASSETTYEVTTSEFATLSSHASARDRVMQEVSADIRQQIATFLAGKAPPQVLQ
jgi:LPS-assembly lipoprotein